MLYSYTRPAFQLFKKTDHTEEGCTGKSLGPRSTETKKILAAFAFFLVFKLFRRVFFNMLCMVNVWLIGF